MIRSVSKLLATCVFFIFLTFTVDVTLSTDHAVEDPEFKYSREANKEDASTGNHDLVSGISEQIRVMAEDSLAHKKFEDAMETFDRAYALNPHNQKILASRALCQLELGRPFDAFLDANEALITDALDKKAAEVKIRAMVALMCRPEGVLRTVSKLGGTESFADKEVIQKLEEDAVTVTQQIDKAVGRQLAKEGEAHQLKGELAEASESYGKALEKVAFRSEVYFALLSNRASCFLQLKEWKSAYLHAVQLLDTSTEMNVMEALGIKAESLRLLNRPVEAASTYEKMLRHGPPQPVASEIPRILSDLEKVIRDKEQMAMKIAEQLEPSMGEWELRNVVKTGI